MIKIKNITKTFDEYTAIENLSLNVGNSSIYGLVGYNGAGKTTLLKTAAGVYMPDSGTVEIDGTDLFKNPEKKQELFYVPDDLYFGRAATIKSMARFYSGFYPNFCMKTCGRLAGLFGLDVNKKISGFSKGMQRQTEMVLALSAMPRVILLDESFDGLDPQKRSLTKNLLIEYMVEKECSVIISSHNLHELADMCDHVALINGQKIALDCAVDDMSGSRCKFRLAFTDFPHESMFKSIKYKNFKQDGKIVTFTVSENLDDAEKLIEQLNPAIVERFPMSLEEIFLEEMEDTDYDLTELFA